jgi:hypothetical protein
VSWPTASQEQVLRACFDMCKEPAEETLSDPAALTLLPLLYRRWPDVAGGNGQKAYATTWRRNHRRLAELSSLIGVLDNAGVRCVVLKGAALVLGHYRDAGVRPMRDVDLLVAECDVEKAIGHLLRNGWTPEGGLSTARVLGRMRVGHAWQFARGSDEVCDLHWRPVVRCFSPEITRLFHEGAVTVALDGRTAAVPCATDQLFHVCAHGLQPDWTPQIQWVADALTVLTEPIDWDRLARLTAEASMSVRLSRGLDYLRTRFGAPVPEALPRRLAAAAPAWERREYRVLLKPSPLGLADSVAWHAYHFRRIRRHDPAWRAAPFALAFPRYLAAFLDVPGGALLKSLWRQVESRLRQ